jgi:hypothetical protein
MCCCWRLPHLPLFGSSSVAGGRGGKDGTCRAPAFRGRLVREVRRVVGTPRPVVVWYKTYCHTTHTTHKQLRNPFLVRRSNYLFFSWLLEMNGLGTPGVIEWRSV